jgi:hypothetical protein
VDHHPKADQDLKDADPKVDLHPKADQGPKGDQDPKVARHLKAEDLVDFSQTLSDLSSEPCSLIETVTENSIETN